MSLSPQQFEMHQSLQRIGNPRLPNTKVYEITDLSHLGRGLGLTADQDIKRGTRILAEEALFSISGIPDSGLSDQNRKAIWRLAGPDGPHHATFSTLHAPVRNGRVTLTGRFETNNFDMGVDGNGNYTKGIFPEASRINHLCLPNAFYMYNPAIDRLTIHATADIRQGEEILISYQQRDCLKTRAERQRYLDKWAFTCTCPACNPTTPYGRFSDGRRAAMAALEARIVQNQDLYGVGDRDRQRRDIEELIRQIPLEGDLYVPLIANYRRLAVFCDEEWQATNRNAVEEREGLARDAMEAARRSLDLEVVCGGCDSTGVGETLDWMVGLECRGWD